MYVKAIIILCIVIICLVLYLFFKGQTNRRSVPGNKDIVNKLKDTTRSASGINSTLKGNTEAGQDLASDIGQNNTDARKGIDNALRILEEAEKPNNT
jgi:hypothetical protein